MFLSWVLLATWTSDPGSLKGQVQWGRAKGAVRCKAAGGEPGVAQRSAVGPAGLPGAA